MKTSDHAFAALRGLFNITVTPFRAVGSFDPQAFADTAERMIAFDYDGLLVGGTYGEFAVMTPEERAGLFRTTVDVVRDRVPVLLCAAHSDVRVVKELSALAARPLLRAARDVQDTGEASRQAPERSQACADCVN
jgi:dihydrodipicolinate synthase/N-acetylneuraminate lyase